MNVSSRVIFLWCTVKEIHVRKEDMFYSSSRSKARNIEESFTYLAHRKYDVEIRKQLPVELLWCRSLGNVSCFYRTILLEFESRNLERVTRRWTFSCVALPARISHDISRCSCREKLCRRYAAVLTTWSYLKALFHLDKFTEFKNLVRKLYPLRLAKEY